MQKRVTTNVIVLDDTDDEDPIIKSSNKGPRCETETAQSTTNTKPTSEDAVDEVFKDIDASKEVSIDNMNMIMDEVDDTALDSVSSNEEVE